MVQGADDDWRSEIVFCRPVILVTFGLVDVGPVIIQCKDPLLEKAFFLYHTT